MQFKEGKIQVNAEEMKTHILIVDDEEQVRHVVARFLVKRGYHVSTCGSSAETWQLLEREAVDVVVLDIEIGEENGLELLGELQNKYPHLPAIIMTGRGCDEELFQVARARGAAGYVSKLLRIDQLLMDIKRILDRCSVRGQAA